MWPVKMDHCDWTEKQAWYFWLVGKGKKIILDGWNLKIKFQIIQIRFVKFKISWHKNLNLKKTNLTIDKTHQLVCKLFGGREEVPPRPMNRQEVLNPRPLVDWRRRCIRLFQPLYKKRKGSLRMSHQRCASLRPAGAAGATSWPTVASSAPWRRPTWRPSAGPCWPTACCTTAGTRTSRASSGTWSRPARTEPPRRSPTTPVRRDWELWELTLVWSWSFSGCPCSLTHWFQSSLDALCLLHLNDILHCRSKLKTSSIEARYEDSCGERKIPKHVLTYIIYLIFPNNKDLFGWNLLDFSLVKHT